MYILIQTTIEIALLAILIPVAVWSVRQLLQALSRDPQDADIWADPETKTGLGQQPQTGTLKLSEKSPSNQPNNNK